MNELRIGVIGGVPKVLGGGGLERQIELTIAALGRRGHRALRVAEIDPADPPDLMHDFGNGADNWQQLVHWRQNHRPLVVSPVIVCSPGRSERSLMIGARLGGRIPNVNSMTRDVVRRADVVVALTEYERSVVQRLAPQADVRVVGNGVEPVEPAPRSPIPDGDSYVVMLGTVESRKRQVDVLKQLGNDHRMVIVGGLGRRQDRAEFERLVDSKHAVWTGELSDTADVRRILADAKALLLFSDAEGQSLAVIEALASGTPVVVSPLPSHRELAERFPGWVTMADSLDAADRALRTLTRPSGVATPEIPTWDDVAAQLEQIYVELLARGNRD